MTDPVNGPSSSVLHVGSAGVVALAWDAASSRFTPICVGVDGKLCTEAAAEGLTDQQLRVAPVSGVRAGASFRNIAGSGTTVVKSGAGVLERIVVNKAILSSVITLYDNTAASGAKIGTISQPVILLKNQFDLEYGCAFVNGLTVVTSAADDITVIYR